MATRKVPIGAGVRYRGRLGRVIPWPRGIERCRGQIWVDFPRFGSRAVEARFCTYVAKTFEAADYWDRAEAARDALAKALGR